MNKNDVSLFSFNQETSFIIYKKVPLLTQDIQALSNIETTKKITPSFLYDKYTNQFIYINGEIIIILTTKCHMNIFSRINIEENIKSVSVEYNNKYIIITTCDYKLNIFNLLDLEKVDYSGNKKTQYIGGFFIPYKSPEKKHNYFIVCLMTKNNFQIKRIQKQKYEYNNTFKYSNKTSYISNRMTILDYDFNHNFKLLLIIKPNSFVIFNLKSKNCYKIPITINIGNIKDNEFKLYIQQIYEKLYLVHLTNKNYIDIYRLDNLKNVKKPRKIEYDQSEENSNINNMKLQFYNNLIFIYMTNFIKIYDIKSKSKNYEISIINIKEKDYKFFINSNIFGKYLLMNDEYYKIKFLKDKFKEKSNYLSKYVFFALLRRKNSNLIIKQILFEYLNNDKIFNFFDVLEEIIINHKKFITKIYTIYSDDKNNAYKVIYKGNNQFFLTEDYLFTLFNQNFDKKIYPEILLKALCYMFYLYNKYDFDWNINLFYASIFTQLNKIDDVNFFEFVVKNKFIPINEKIGIYFIMRAKSFNKKEKYERCFNLGIDILMNECQYGENNINDIIQNINSNNFIESFDIIFNVFFKILFN